VNLPLDQHQKEIQLNLQYWKGKPLLQEVYAGFYRRIVGKINPALPGRVVEIGSGIGNLKAHYAGAITTDLFPNPWLDLVCDGYELPFQDGSLSHLVMFDVFHHLEAPAAFLKEARRVLSPGGRVVVFDLYMSLASRPVFEYLHHEPVGMKWPINRAGHLPRPRAYYAAQGNATRVFFRQEMPGWPAGWRVDSAEAFCSFCYLLSGGYSKPAFYPQAARPVLERLDGFLSRWPRLFATRCLVVMTPDDQGGPCVSRGLF
jgi:SAM-dependent methyltransferase